MKDGEITVCICGSTTKIHNRECWEEQYRRTRRDALRVYKGVYDDLHGKNQEQLEETEGIQVQFPKNSRETA